MNCKPHQLATLVRAPCSKPCAERALGVTVKTDRLANSHDVDSMDLLTMVFDGPLWLLEWPMHCPHGHADCPGIDRLPDSCLRPFRDESAPGVDEELVQRVLQATGN